MNSTFTRRIVVVVALAGLLMTGIAAAGMSSTRHVTTASTGGAASVLSILAQRQDPADHFPATSAGEAISPNAIDLATTRLLMKDETGSYFAAQSDRGQVCLVVYTSAGSSMTGCTDVKNFREHGISSGFRSAAEGNLEAYLVPDGTSASSNTAGLTVHHKNLLVGDTEGVPKEHAIQRLRTITGGRVDLRLLGVN
jgi:hypothetical protein